MNSVTRVFLLFAAFITIGSVRGSISVEFQFGAVNVPAGSIGVIVVDTGGNGFEGLSNAAGVPLTPGNMLGGDDKIIAVFSNRDLTEWSSKKGFTEHLAVLDYEELGVEEGQAWSLYVFSERSPGQNIRSGEPHVVYVPEGGMIGFTPNSSMGATLPPDGGAYLAALIDTTLGGDANLKGVDLASPPLDDRNGSVERELESGAQHTYFFEMTQAGFISISGSGDPGLRAELYDENGTLIASSSGEHPFFIEENLRAGFHRLVIYDGSAVPSTFDYRIDFNSQYIRHVRPDVAVGKNLKNLVGQEEYKRPYPMVKIIAKNARPVKGVATVENRGDRPEALKVRGRKTSKFFKVLYQYSKKNITGKVITGKHYTGVIDSNSPKHRIAVKIKPIRKTLVTNVSGQRTILKRGYTTSVRASSSSDAKLIDGGRLRAITR